MGVPSLGHPSFECAVSVYWFLKLCRWMIIPLSTLIASPNVLFKISVLGGTGFHTPKHIDL